MRTLKIWSMIAALLVLAQIIFAADAFSENLWLKEKYRWVQIATSPDRNTAIGIAHLFEMREPSVVKMAGGDYGVLLGPAPVHSVDEFRSLYDKGWSGFEKPADAQLVGTWLKLPKDTTLSTGRDYRQIVWSQNSDLLVSKVFEESTEVKYQNFSVSISSIGGQTILGLRAGKKPVGRFTFKTSTDGEVDGHLHLVELGWLDHSRSKPQVILQTLSKKGTFTVTHSWVFSEVDGGGWAMFDAGSAGFLGYQLEDVDGDGNVELVADDQTFSRPFGGGGQFNSPTVIKRLVGGRLLDVTAAKSSLDRMKQAVARFEYVGRVFPAIWHENSYLAAWVAIKTRAGDFSTAWSTMLSGYDPIAKPEPMVCNDNMDIEACPADKMRRASFPQALAARLRFAGYRIPDTLPDTPDGLPDPDTVVAKAPPSDGARIDQGGASGKDDEKQSGQLYSGSGFFVAKGKLVSNAHVVDGCKDITVKLGGVEGKGNVAARDPANDLALIDTAVPTGPLATLRTAPRLGEAISAFGFPLTDILATTGNFTRGNVTATAGMGDDSRFLQISAPVQPGNSGGPLLDESGNVVGIVNAKIDALVMAKLIKDIPENINFAIKSSILENFLDARGVGYVSGTLAAKLDPADIADRAQSFTAIIYCRT